MFFKKDLVNTRCARYPFRILEIQEHAEALSYDQLTMIRMREAVVADLPGFAEDDED